MAASNGGTRARTSMLAGTSLAAATIIAASAGVALTPTAALAANECGDPAANGATADIFQCVDTAPFAAIVYPATNGNLTLQLQDVTVTTGGIQVTTATNAVTINRVADTTDSGDPQITNTTGAGISIIRTGGTGNFVVDLSDTDSADPQMSVTGTTAGVYLSNMGTGQQTLTTNNGSITATAGVGVRLGTTGTGNITFNNNSTVTGTTGAVLVAEGVNATLNNQTGGVLLGAVNFNNTGNVTFNNTGVWQAGGTVAMGAGTSTLTNSNGPVTLGTIVVDGTLTFAGLENFNNGGLIVFGAGADFTSTDGVANDRLVVGTNFNSIKPNAGGGGGVPIPDLGTLVMDVEVGSASQTSCAAAVSADCMDLRGFAVTGPAVTSIVLNPVSGADGEMAQRIVLVDAGGGTLSEGQFVLSPDSPGYMVGEGGLTGVDSGAMAYTLLTDEAADQVYLSAGPGSSTVRYAQLAEVAQAAWELTASTWFERQVELREGEEPGGGVWLRASHGYLDRTAVAQAGPYTFDTSFEQTAMVLAGGVDIAGRSGDGTWLVGLTAAHIDSDVEQVGVGPDHELQGYAVGAYGSWFNGPIFVDGLVSYASLDTTTAFVAEDGEATTLGVQVEAGYSYRLGDGPITLQPLAALAYVRTELDEASIGGAPVLIDEVTELRAALGLRISGDAEVAGLRARFAFTGRAWQQFDGELAGSTAGGEFAYDDNRDLLGDVGLSAAVFGLAERLSVQASARLKFQDAYQAGEVALGVRWVW